MLWLLVNLVRVGAVSTGWGMWLLPAAVVVDRAAPWLAVFSAIFGAGLLVGSL